MYGYTRGYYAFIFLHNNQFLKKRMFFSPFHISFVWVFCCYFYYFAIISFCWKSIVRQRKFSIWPVNWRFLSEFYQLLKSLTKNSFSLSFSVFSIELLLCWTRSILAAFFSLSNVIRCSISSSMRTCMLFFVFGIHFTTHSVIQLDLFSFDFAC